MNQSRNILKQALTVFLLFLSLSIIATPATLVVDANLNKSASFDSVQLATLSKGENVDIQQRERGWYQILTSNQQLGWITLLQVRFRAATESTGSSTFSRIISLRKGHSDVSATTGVRGIGEADIKNSKANFVALETVKGYRVGKEEVVEYARNIALATQQIKYQEQRDED